KGQKPTLVPDVAGQQIAAALATLDAQKLRAHVVRVPSDQPAGQVLAQHPNAGSRAPEGSAVRLNVAAGKPPDSGTTTPERPAAPPAKPAPVAATVTVPDVRGQKLNAGKKALREAGLVTEIRRVP